MTHDEILQGLYDNTLVGNAPVVKELTEQGLADGMDPETLLYDALIPSLEEVGARFERGDFFVPEMLIAARAMQGALDILRPLLAETGAKPIGTFVMGTVKGDVHDIGKNLVNIMLEGAGFTVHDLGVNVPPEKFIEQIQEHEPDIVGFSAFLTTTMPMFKANINALEKAGLRDKVIVMVGGAPVTQEYADAVGADGYAADASTAVRLAKDADRAPPVGGGDRHDAKRSPSGCASWPRRGQRRGDAARRRRPGRAGDPLPAGTLGLHHRRCPGADPRRAGARPRSRSAPPATRRCRTWPPARIAGAGRRSTGCWAASGRGRRWTTCWWSPGRHEAAGRRATPARWTCCARACWSATASSAPGVAGHPEGSPDIAPEAVVAAMREKNAFAERSPIELRIVTQFALAAEPYVAWERRCARPATGCPWWPACPA